MSDNDDRRGKRTGGPRHKGPGRGFGGPRGDRDGGGGGGRKFSGKPRFDRDRGEGGREGGDRKPYGKPRFDRERGEGGRSEGERKSFGKPRFDRDREGGPGGGSGSGGERKPSGKPRFDRDRGEGERGGGDRKPYGKPRFDRDRGEGERGGGDRKPYGKPRFDRDRGEGGRGGGDRRPYGKPRFDRERGEGGRGDGDRKPYTKPRFERDRGEGGRDGDRKPFGKPRFDRDRDRGGERDRDRGERKFHGKPRFDKERKRDDRSPRDGGAPAKERAQDDQFVRVSGLPSVTELFRASPDRVERLFFTKDMHPEVNAFCTKLAERRKIYREVEADELRRVAGTAMHGGVVALAEPKAITDLDEAEAQAWASAGEMLIVLDGVGNPQNIGAIARTASFLGLKRLIVSDHAAQAGLSNAAYRIAKGGLEGLDVYRARDLPGALRRLKAHFHVVGTALGTGSPLESLPLAPKPVAIVLGNEEHGLEEATLAACHSVVSIPGGGAVQSLNVSAAAAILIHALQRRAKRA